MPPLPRNGPRSLHPRPRPEGPMNDRSNAFARRLLAAVLLCATVSPPLPASAAKPAYPPSPIVAVADTLHGTVLIDSYRWLEDGESEAVRHWSDAQNSFTRNVLDQYPGREELREKLRALYAVTTTGEARVRGARLYYSRHVGTQNQPVVLMREGADRARVALDPNTLSSDGTVAL